MYLYQILGITNVALLVVITSPYWLRLLGKWLFPKKKIAASKFMKALRKIHKPLGICLILIALTHGYLALGALRLHTGTIVGAMVLITATLGGAFYRLKKPAIFKWHKRAALLTALLVLLHLIVPSVLSSLLG